MDLSEAQRAGESLAPLHEKHLELLLYLRDFCRELGIDFCLAYGTALGALRHGGPIPWDDDADVMMSAASYEIFRREFMRRGDRQRFYLQECISIEGMTEFSKLRLNNTCFIQDNLASLKMHQGIYIDIFILHEKPEGRLSLLAGRLAGYYTELKRMSNQHYSGHGWALPIMALLRLFPPAFGLKTALRLMYRGDKSPSESFVSWGIPMRCCPKDMIFPPRMTEYSGRSLPVPGRAEDYLRYVYGNWEKPPESISLHAASWSCEEDFRSVLPDMDSFSDEIHIPPEK